MTKNSPLFLGLFLFACSSSSGGPGGGSGSGGAAGTGGSGTPRGGSGGTGATGGSGGSVAGSGGSVAGSGGSVAGSGGSGGSGGTAGAATGGSDGAAPRDTGPAPMVDAGRGDVPPAGGSPGAPLEGLLVQVQCPAGTAALSTHCSVPLTTRQFTRSFTLGGNPATMYKVHVRFCGVFEGLGYTACMANPDNAANPAVCVDGTRPTGGNPGTYPTLGIRVARPCR
jgi:hypothetical protein